MAPIPGLLYVTMQPAASLPNDQFHDWYDNEHGPLRLRLPFIENGFRYRATDLEGAGKGLPEWVALYDVTDMSEMVKEPYTTLRLDGVKSQREKQTMAQIAVDRRLYDFVDDTRSKGFKPLENVDDTAASGNVLIAVSMTVHPGKEAELDKWYREEHTPLLSKVPGWLRTRRFVSSSVEPKAVTEHIALHEYAAQNGLGGAEFQAATSTPWREEIMANVVKDKSRRTYEWYYTFGPAPRDLTPLPSGVSATFTSPDGKTKTIPGSPPAIESFITTPDGVDLPFRLEGSTEPNAPLIVLSNSILVEWGIWDGFVQAFLAAPENKKFRILRYHTRGRLSKCGDNSITVDVLAADIITLLDALRVPKAAALIGVSLGGVTVLNAALKYANRVSQFIACDTNALSPPGNSKAWGERIAIAEKEDAAASNGEKIVGEQLAEVTVRRWFVKETYDGGKMEALAERVKAMVQNNSLQGFRQSVQALFAYDLREEMKNSDAGGAFFVGSGDGILPKTMKEMSTQLGSGAEYVVIEGAGHLPMVEKPEEFAASVSKFLSGR